MEKQKPRSKNTNKTWNMTMFFEGCQVSPTELHDGIQAFQRFCSRTPHQGASLPIRELNSALLHFSRIFINYPPFDLLCLLFSGEQIAVHPFVKKKLHKYTRLERRTVQIKRVQLMSADPWQSIVCGPDCCHGNSIFIIKRLAKVTAEKI